MEQVFVNAVGEQCPVPVLKAAKALSAMTEPGTLEVRVDNEVAVQNLARMAAGYKLAASIEKLHDKEYTVTMEVAAPVGGSPLEEPPMVSCSAGTPDGLVIAVDTAVMGRGDGQLGALLMKGFLYAVTQLPELPKAMIFYNSGAKLTCEGSGSLEDLKSLAAQGVGIFTCGTCLNHYGLTDQLAVGEITNMYEIVEKLARAGKVVKP